MRKKRLQNEFVAADPDATEQEQVHEIMLKLGSQTYEWFMITQQTIFPAEGVRHATRDEFISDLASALTCHYRVLGVYYQGHRLPDVEIEAFKKEAVDGLGPISRARADGRI